MIQNPKSKIQSLKSIDEWLLEPMVELAEQIREQTPLRWLSSLRVARFALALARSAGLDNQTMMAIQCAALLHDVGMLNIRTEVLDKPSALSRDERDYITKHSMASWVMLRTKELPAIIASIAQAHHEWYNGKGYPLGLEGEAIPSGARVLGVAGALEAMRSDRPYRGAFSTTEIAQELTRGAGTQFDPGLVAAALSLLAGDIDLVQGPPRLLRVVTGDRMLYHQICFAAYPHGWEVEMCDPCNQGDRSNEFLGATDTDKRGERPDLTIIDGGGVRCAPDMLATRPLNKTLWIDPADAQEPAIHRPLSLWQLLDHLDVEPGSGSFRPARVEKIKVLIADPYILFRQALKSCLEGTPEIEVVGEARSPDEFRKAKEHFDYHVAIVASDLLVGTNSTAPLSATDYYLQEDEGHTGNGEKRGMIVLVADEDMDGIPGPGAQDPNWDPGRLRPLYVPRSAPPETLVARLRFLYEAANKDDL